MTTLLQSNFKKLFLLVIFFTFSNNISTFAKTDILTVNDQSSLVDEPEAVLLEAENEYQVVSNPGSRDIYTFYASTASNSNVLTLFDKGDKIAIPFSLTNDAPVEIELKVRVRSGNVNASSNYWPNGYSFELNDQTIELTGDQSTISNYTSNLGGSYWGTMISEKISLSNINNSLAITSNTNWAAVDYVEIIIYSSGSGETIDELPIVDAGERALFKLPTNSTTLSGSGSDPDGGSVTFLWSQLSGPSQAILQDSTTATLNVSNLIEGTYSFNLQVTDDEGNSVNDQVNVIVQAAKVDELPVSWADYDKQITLPVTTVKLSGNGYDPDGGSVSFLWTQLSGPSQATFSDATASDVYLSYLVVGTYTFNLEVTDDEGSSTSDQVIVVVNPISNTSDSIITKIEAQKNYTIINDAGSHQIGLYYAKDASGESVINMFDKGDKINLIFSVGNDLPIDFKIKLRVRSGNVNGAQTYWPNGYAFKLNDQEIELTGDPTSLSDYTSSLGGSYFGDMVSERLTATQDNQVLEITAAAGWAAVDYLTIIIYPSGTNTEPTDELPLVSAGDNKEITLPTNSVSLSGTGSDPDGGNVTYLWSQISGPSQSTITDSTSTNAQITDLIAGVYVFDLKVTDDEANVVHDSVSVTVNEAPSPSCSGNVTLANQQEVDKFNCEEFTGNIYIGGNISSDITNLNSLSGLKVINGSLIISNNPSLTSLSGLSSLNTVTGGISITNNNSLSNLNGFPTNLTELDSISIVSNSSLINLNGLTSLSVIYSKITIENNASLSDISGLENVIALTGNDLSIKIRFNSILNECCVLPSLINNTGGTITIYNNSVGCNSVDQINLGCGGLAFVEQTIPGLEGKNIVDLKWGDMNNDGVEDIVLIEDIDSTYYDFTYYEIAVYNSVNGTYDKVSNSASIVDADNEAIKIDTLVDYNKDGWLDIIATSSQTFYWHFNIYNLNNNKDGSYSSNILASNGGYGHGFLKDADRDGDLDLYFQGYDESGYYFQKIRNTYYDEYSYGSSPNYPIFPSYPLEDNSIHPIYEYYADVDQDGDLDVLIVSNYFSYEEVLTGYAIFQNENIGNFQNMVNIEMGSIVRASAYGFNPLSDIDIDGDYDILADQNYEYTGNDDFVTTSKQIQQIGDYDFDHDGISDKLVLYPQYKLYKGQSNGSFTEFLTLSDKAAGWIDYDNDGDYDLYTKDGKILINTVNESSVDQAPSTPSNLNVQTTSNSATLSWNKATDDLTPQNALTYELVVRKGSETIINASSDIVPKFTVNGLTEGTYNWKVKTLDKGLNSSSYSPEQSFEITYDDASCIISSVEIDELDNCSGDTFNQTLTINFSNEPTGNILINGEEFDVVNNPLEVTLYNLPVSNEPTDLSISFVNNASCSYFQEDAIVAPSSCYCYSSVRLESQDDVDAFSCTSIGGNVYITGNITNLDGLSELESIAGALTIDNVIGLESLDGLDALKSIQSIYIKNNTSLTDISALSSLETINNAIIVTNNSQLAECCTLLDLLSLTDGTISISENAGGCTNTTDIESTCNPTETFSELIEIEDNYTIITDAGSNIIRDENNSTFSGRGTLLMYDKGDKVRVNFDVPHASNYQLNVRLRSGNSVSSSNYFSNGYQFFVDDSETSFTGDLSSVVHTSSEYGNSHFGVMNSDIVYLTAGSHYLDIQTKYAWCIIDYIEVVEVDGTSSRFASDLTTNELTTEEGEEFIIYPNPSNGKFIVNFKTKNADSELYLQITDVTGKAVYQKYFNNTISENFDLSNFSKGIFIFSIKSDIGIYSKKVILK
ncbi:PKD domain-containing protein [Chondrinema litorale]|uniref:PKD domain-containing protein n=1 Tax=Chondrinema litorale TaxID=2994555 RepID=UPI0025437C67|nr:T9SS type A sorting domain-containing protein [Chondrinema litorale]UZR98134.1 T9SS type A sorting domain-containing protein [Chondrinema litorale]